MSYSFVNSFNNLDNQPRYSFYYQVCYYINPESNLHDVKKYVINEDNDIISVSNFGLTKKQYKKFKMGMPLNKYKLYPTFDLNTTPKPSKSEFVMSKSSMINNNYDYSGFAPFN